MTFISFSAFAQNKSSITVSINNVSSDEGSVGYALYNKDNFMVAAPVKAAKSEIVEPPILLYDPLYDFETAIQGANDNFVFFQ